jgi:predicted nuclease of restriction endonuclease-like (RecB) superfamily
VEYEQRGKNRADYGDKLIERLSADLQKRFGRGFNKRNLDNMRRVYLFWPKLFLTEDEATPKKLRSSRQSTYEKRHSVSAELRGKRQTVSAELPFYLVNGKVQIVSAQLSGKVHSVSALLSWTHYRRLIAVESKEARDFYETEAVRGGWSVRQLDRQISTQFYERTALSRDKASMLRKGQIPGEDEILSPEQEIKDPTVLEFLDLKDEYSESDIEDALIHRLEDFLLELGSGFTFVARQKRLRIGDEWYRIDLVLYHRKLRCLVLIDLKAGKFTHADAGQMNLYLNYAKERMTLPDENPPVGIILCAGHNDTVVHYALGGLKNKVLATQYKLQLPDENRIKAEFQRVRRELKGEK